MNSVVCDPPFELTVLVSEFCCEARAVRVSFPNCNVVFKPKSAVLPFINEEPVVIDTLPASILLIISSSSPSYFNLRFLESKSKVASVL